MFSTDLRWRCVVLHFVYAATLENVALIMGVSKRSMKRWMQLFERTGQVVSDAPRQQSARWPQEVYDFVEGYVLTNPCFYMQELQDELKTTFPAVNNVSLPTICRALRHDLKLSRKILEKRARESIPEQIMEYYNKLALVYSFPEQLIFIDETSKDGRDALRRHGWSRINEPAVVRQPFQRGCRVSALAAFDTSGFFAWKCTDGTFTRQKFHDVFIQEICPHLQPWPMPRSVVILDNAKIHMYKELEQAIHRSGAILLFLPPYSPQLNPIEQGFALLKQFLQKNCDLTFRVCPEAVLKVAMPACTKLRGGGRPFFRSCGYGDKTLDRTIFQI
jgi:transposase